MKTLKNAINVIGSYLINMIVFTICGVAVITTITGCQSFRRGLNDNAQEILRKSVIVKNIDGKNDAVIEVPNISEIISHKPSEEDTYEYLVETLKKGEFVTTHYRKSIINESGDDITESVVDILIQDEFTKAINKLLESEE